MSQLVQCVPNFSNGRDRDVIGAIVAAIEGVTGATVLHVDAGVATNRTVVTFVASPTAAEDAAFRAITEAARLIDMRHHRGVHPRQGATDVCPFVPLRGVGMHECVALAHRVGRRVGAELAIPVYFYGEAATQPARRRLARVRAGGYERLVQKLEQPAWRPDCGPPAPNTRSGATAIGARALMVAYNVNLETRDVSVAQRIARVVREKGYLRRDAVVGSSSARDGGAVRVRGLPGCQANGWVIEEYGCAQVTTNLLDHRITGLHAAFDRVKQLANECGVAVTGSELVGLVPERALFQAGEHYLRLAGVHSGDATDATFIQSAVTGLGLADLAPFDPQTRILEHCLDALPAGHSACPHGLGRSGGTRPLEAVLPPASRPQ